MIAPYSCMVAVSLAGIFGNTCLVLATFTRKSLQGVCNIFIAIEAALNIIGELSTPLDLYFLFNNSHYLTIRACWYVQFIPMFCTNMSLTLTLMIGIDRLLSVVAPIFVRNINRPKYFCAILSFPLIVGLTCAILSYEPMLLVADNYVFCTTAEFKQGYLKNVMSYYNLSVAGSLVFLYAYIWFLVKTTKVVSVQSRKILKSLTVITLTIAAAFPTGQLGILLFRMLFEPRIFNIFVGYFGAITQIGFSMNFYVFYCFSSEYRLAFQHLFSYFKFCKKNTNAQKSIRSVVPMQKY